MADNPELRPKFDPSKNDKMQMNPMFAHLMQKQNPQPMGAQQQEAQDYSQKLSSEAGADFDPYANKGPFGGRNRRRVNKDPFADDGDSGMLSDIKSGM